MAANSNIISREVLQLDVSSKEEYLGLKDELEELMNVKIPNAVENIYYNIFSEEDIVRIDRLNIDLGALSSFNLTGEFLSKFSSVFKEELIKVKAEESRRYIKEHGGTEFQLLIFFLLNGDLPWWVNKNSGINLYEIFQKILHDDFEKLLSFLVAEHGNKEIFLRIENQLSRDIFISINHVIIKNYLPEFEPILVPVKKLLEIISTIHAANLNPDKLVTLSLLSLFSKHENITVRSLTYEIIIRISVFGALAGEEFYSSVITQFQKISGRSEIINPAVLNLFIELVMVDSPELLKEYSERIIKVLNEQRNLTSSEELDNTIKILQKEDYTEAKFFDKLNGITGLPDEEEMPVKVLPEITEIPSDESEYGEDEIFINNAGISLIAVYLPALFDKLNLLRKGIFNNINSARRAALLINYITHKTVKAFEYELQLNKLLCGLDLKETLPKEIEISEREIDEIELMLISIIKNWAAIKNTSVEGLRTSFIRREGILSEKEGLYKLKVNRKSHDVILEALPWSISIIKFKWMNKPVYVEW